MEPAPNTLNNAHLTCAPEPMQYPMKARFRAAANRATRALPALLGPAVGGPIGEVVARELMVIDEFGWLLGGQAFGTRLLKAVEALPSDTVPQQSSCRGFIPGKP